MKLRWVPLLWIVWVPLASVGFFPHPALAARTPTPESCPGTKAAPDGIAVAANATAPAATAVTHDSARAAPRRPRHSLVTESS
jgi:hypothetical protein